MSVNFGRKYSSINCNEYVTINDATNFSKNVKQTLEDASDVIGRYAKAKKAKVAFLPQLDSDYFYITTLSKDAKVVSCPLNMDKDLNRINISKKIGSNVVSTSLVYPKSTKNKSFLRKVYEQIQYMVEGTEPRIESMKKDTLARLRAIGKIK